MSYYGSSYADFLDAAAHPGSPKYEKRYRGRKSPAPVLKTDAALIRRYLDERTSQGLGQASAKVAASFLCLISRKFPRFDQMNTETANSAFSYLRTMKPNSTRRAMHVLRHFIVWMADENINTVIDPKKIQKIKPPAPNYITKKASDMLSGEEIRHLIETAGNDRDRALISMLYEGSLRPIEAASATWGDLNFDQYGAQFSTSKKTGKARYIRLIMAAPYLLKWKNNYPEQITSTSPLFTAFKRHNGSKDHPPLTVMGIKTVFGLILERSGIKKQISPYYLRHSRITAMINDEIPDSVVKMQAWGSLRSNMLATYAHVSNKDIDRILLTRAGVVTTEKTRDDSLKPRQCPHCGGINRPTAKFCETCGLPLTEEARASLQTATAKVEDDPRFKMAFDAAMRALETGPADHAPGASG